MSATLTMPATSSNQARHAAFACAMALAVALGVGRFAFTPLLPLMLASGMLDIRHGGWLASANYAGYFIGAISCAIIRVDHAKMVRFGLAATVLLTLLMGMTDTFWFWAGIRFTAGIVSAWTFVFASQWGLRRLAELGAPGLSGVIYTGPGVGIVITGLLGAAATSIHPAYVWMAFAALSALAAGVAWRPFDHGVARPATSTANKANGQSANAEAIWLVGLYGLPGFGYIITATFLPVIARHALPGSPWPDLFWPLFGVALSVGALIAARLPLHWDNRLLMAASYVVQAIGIASGILFPSTLGFALGSILVGLPFTAITLFAMREARRLRGEQAAGLMGYATASYGLGQILGPIVAAPIAAHTGSFSLALGMAIAALLLGSIGLVYVANARRNHD